MKAVITGRDFPPVRFGIMPVTQDEEALCVEKVRFVGDPVAAVAAVDEETAEAAARLIDVEYEPLDSLMSIDAALRDEIIAAYADAGGPGEPSAVVPLMRLESLLSALIALTRVARGLPSDREFTALLLATLDELA